MVEVTLTDDMVCGPADSVPRDAVCGALYDHRELELSLFGRSGSPIFFATTGHDRARRVADELGCVLEERGQGSVGHTFAQTALFIALLGIALQVFVAMYIDSVFSRFVIAVPLFIFSRAAARFAVRAGVDGITASRPLHPDRFWPYGAIDHVERDQHRLILHLRAGGVVELRMRRFGDHGAIDAVRARIVDGVEERTAVVDPALSAALDPRRYARAEWIEHLRTLRGGGYRLASVTDDELWAVIEDNAEDEAVRAAAVIVLGASLDDEGRQRVRLALTEDSSWPLRGVAQAMSEGRTAAAEDGARALAYPTR